LVDKEAPAIKLCDFGLAEIADDEVELVGLAGSTPYMAPEVVEGTGHGKPVDVYATGVIMYILLCGYPPFEPENGITELEFPSPEWDVISPVAKDLIEKLLGSDPNRRPTPDEALKHPWFKDVETLREFPLYRTVGTLRKFKEVSQDPKSSMKEYRGQGRGSVMGIFDERMPSEKTSPPVHTEEKKKETLNPDTNGLRKESLSGSTSVSASAEDIITDFQKELFKTREKMTSLKKETSHLRLKLAEQVAIRQEIEMRMKWELEMLRKEAEEEQKNGNGYNHRWNSSKIPNPKKLKNPSHLAKTKKVQKNKIKKLDNTTKFPPHKSTVDFQES